MDSQQIIISVSETIRGRFVKASVGFSLDSDDRVLERAREVIERYLEMEKQGWEEEGIDFWLNPAICLFDDTDVINAMPLEVAREVPFPVQKDFSGYDTSGKTCGEVYDENQGLGRWLAEKFTEYEEIPAQKAAVCAMRKLCWQEVPF
tara:strand:- start:1025 stop:1468 length:444 start_codon:yes stop_codon:yes gene_type:complete